MIKIVTAAQRHTSNRDWIHSEFSFSFGDYDDPSNAHFGCLLAHNDNELQPMTGMKDHPHQNLEIVSYVVSGILHHEDDLGNEAELQPGTVQVMSAGTGIRHSESNRSELGPVRFLQLWLLPARPGAEPRWDAKHFPPEFRQDTLLPVVSGSGQEGTLSVNEDVTIYLSLLGPEKELKHPLKENRRAHLFVISGNLELDCRDGSFNLGAGDAARIRNSCDLKIKGQGEEGSEFILIDLP
ncbi:pirin family protein [Paenibacillus sp. CN-4]|uniref:pirin family protein n=1 Tax=Paenibacillus nanchangensis TaxID=3348343 RepID=UPI00397835E9